MRVVRKHMRSNRSKGLSVPQFRSMVLLRDQPAASLSDVAEFLGASLPTTSRMVTCLVSKGFVTRVHCRDDRRCVRLSLTQRGITALEKSRAATAGQELSRELASLNGDQRRTILGIWVCLKRCLPRAL